MTGTATATGRTFEVAVPTLRRDAEEAWNKTAASERANNSSETALYPYG